MTDVLAHRTELADCVTAVDVLEVVGELHAAARVIDRALRHQRPGPERDGGHIPGSNGEERFLVVL